jgi:hypothetical protein
MASAGDHGSVLPTRQACPARHRVIFRNRIQSALSRIRRGRGKLAGGAQRRQPFVFSSAIVVRRRSITTRRRDISFITGPRKGISRQSRCRCRLSVRGFVLVNWLAVARPPRPRHLIFRESAQHVA